MTAVAPQQYAASVSSIQNFGSYLGGTASPIITGLVVDRTGSFTLGLVIGAVVMIAAAFFYAVIVSDPIPPEALETGRRMPRLADAD